MTQTRHQSDGLSVPVWNGPDQSFAAGTTTPQSHHVGAGGSLIDKHQPSGVKHTLLSDPASAPPGDVRPFLFRRAQAFFDSYIMSLEKCRSKNRQTAVRLPGIPRLCIAATTSSRVKSGCLATRANNQFAHFSNGDVLPPLDFALALPVLRQR